MSMMTEEELGALEEAGLAGMKLNDLGGAEGREDVALGSSSGNTVLPSAVGAEIIGIV